MELLHGSVWVAHIKFQRLKEPPKAAPVENPFAMGTPSLGPILGCITRKLQLSKAGSWVKCSDVDTHVGSYSRDMSRFTKGATKSSWNHSEQLKHLAKRVCLFWEPSFGWFYDKTTKKPTV